MARLMKDSGIEWIGEIPESWNLLRMKSCIDQRDSGAWGEEATGEEGDTICLRIADFDYARFRFKDTETDELTIRHYDMDVVQKLLLHENDILIEKSGGGEKTPVGRTVLFDKDYPALFANFMDRLRCASFVHPPFMQYLFVTFYKNEYTRNYIKQTTGIQNLDLTSMLSNEKVALPSFIEQKRIAAFLDRKCAEIDAVIERTKATIEEYKKLKQAVITEAVTKGVRGPRPMKDSGIEWIGEIPEDWNITRVGRLCFVTKLAGFEFTDHMMQALSEVGDIPIVRAQHIKMGRFLDTPTEYISFAVSQKLSRCALDQKCLIITFIGAGIGEVALFDKEQRYHLAPNVAKIVIEQEMKQYLSEEYLLYFLMSSAGQEEVNKIKKATAQPSLSMETIRSIKILIPESKDEQAEITAYLDKQCAALDTLIAQKTALLTELETYKKSLIYEYVTGKKEVL